MELSSPEFIVSERVEHPSKEAYISSSEMNSPELWFVYREDCMRHRSPSLASAIRILGISSEKQSVNAKFKVD